MTTEELIERLDGLERAARSGGCDFCECGEADDFLAEQIARLSLELRCELLASRASLRSMQGAQKEQRES